MGEGSSSGGDGSGDNGSGGGGSGDDGSGRGCCLTVVGDDDQAIYAFQGASGSFEPYRRAFPTSRLVILAQNYRSTSTIVAASAALVGRNTERTPKQVWTAQPAGEPILITECRTVADECRYVCEGIRRLLQGGRRPREVAVLFRTARVGTVLQQALCAAALPFNSHASNLWESRPVRELRALLEALIAPADDDAFERVVGALAPTLAAELLGFLHGMRPGGGLGGRGRGGKGGGKGKGEGKGGGGDDAGEGGEARLSLRTLAEQLRAEHRADPPPRPKRPKLDVADEADAAFIAVAESTDLGGKGGRGLVSGGKGGAMGTAKGGKGGGDEVTFDGAHFGALCKCLDTLETLSRRLGVLQLQGLINRCVEALPSKGALHSAPRSCMGSSLLNERAETRTTLAIVQEAVRDFERAQPAQPAGARAPGTNAARGMAPPPPQWPARAPPPPPPPPPAPPPAAAAAPPATAAAAAAAAASGCPGASGPPAPQADDPRAARCRERLQGLIDFWEVLRSEQEGRISQDNSDAITLSSIHGAKGLEWPVVFGVRFNEGECPLTDASTVGRRAAARRPWRPLALMPLACCPPAFRPAAPRDLSLALLSSRLAPRLLPVNRNCSWHWRSSHRQRLPTPAAGAVTLMPCALGSPRLLAQATLEEERRLAYVAISRAKERLVLSHVAVDPSGAPLAPSRFLAELPPHLVKRTLAYFESSVESRTPAAGTSLRRPPAAATGRA